MILILSSKEDYLTSDVIAWLKKPYIRWNADDVIEEINIEIYNSKTEYELGINDLMLNLNDIKNIWYRRGALILKNIKFDKFNKSIQRESNKLLEHLYSKFDIRKSVSSFNDEFFHNKLDTLVLASDLGLKVPNTLITTSKTKLLDFKRANGEIINKSIYNLLERNDENWNASIGTILVKQKEIERLDETFFVSLFQQKIDKKIDIRSFFLNNKYYSMAIFSQENKETLVDFRDYSVFNRLVPYALPTGIERKLTKLMKELKLKSGSIDLILGKDNEFYFLEVNPTGQIGWLSAQCNYYLEREIARAL